MTQVFKILYNNSDITGKASNVRITNSIGRLYNVCSFISDTTLVPESEIDISFGDSNFKGFVYSSTKNGNGEYNIICRTNSAKLTTPYISSETTVVEPARTATELMSYYSSKYNIPIVYSTVDLDFGGDFTRTGTVLDAIATVANVTGAEYYEDNGTIHIVPNKAISGDSVVDISDNEVIDFIPYGTTINQKGVGTIIIGQDVESENTSSDVSCSAFVDGCDGVAILNIVPASSFEYATGLSSVKTILTPTTYKGVIESSDTIKLDSEIKRISNIWLNGSLITDYSFKNDTVVFNTVLRGMLVIEYTALQYMGHVNTYTKDGSKHCDFLVYYGGSQVYSYDNDIYCKNRLSYDQSTITNEDTGETLTIITSDEMNYVKGFSFDTIGETPSIYFYDEESRVPGHVDTSSGDIPILERAYLSENDPDDGKLCYKTRHSISSVISVQSRGEDIPYTENAGVICVDDEYKDVMVAYKTSGLTHDVSFSDIPNGDVTMVVSSSGGFEEFDIGGASEGQIDCTLGQTHTVKVVELLGVTLNSAIDKNVTVMSPSGVITNHIVHGVGIIEVDNMENGLYRIDTSSIIPASYIIMEAILE